MLQALSQKETQVWRELPDVAEFSDRLQYILPGNEAFMANRGAVLLFAGSDAEVNAWCRENGVKM